MNALRTALLNALFWNSIRATSSSQFYASFSLMTFAEPVIVMSCLFISLIDPTIQSIFFYELYLTFPSQPFSGEKSMIVSYLSQGPLS